MKGRVLRAAVPWARRFALGWLVWRVFGPEIQPRTIGIQRRPMAVPGRTVLVGERELFVRELGPADAPPVVLIHSLAGDSAWQAQIERLDERVDSIRIGTLRDRIKTLEAEVARLRQAARAPSSPNTNTSSAFSAAEKVLLKGIPTRIGNTCRPLRSSLPKVAHPVCGRPMIAWSVAAGTACVLLLWWLMRPLFGPRGAGQGDHAHGEPGAQLETEDHAAHDGQERHDPDRPPWHSWSSAASHVVSMSS